MPGIRTRNGQTAIVTMGIWQSDNPDLAQLLGDMPPDELAQLTGHQNEYIPDQDNALAIWAAEFLGGIPIQLNKAAKLPPGVVP